MSDLKILEESKTLLDSNSTIKRRKAAFNIGKFKITELGEMLYLKFLEELKYKRHWETHVEMLKALGVIYYKEAKKKIYDICQVNKKHDMLTISAASAFIRIARNDIFDGKPVLELLGFANFSVATGIFSVLGQDKMLPSKSQIDKILNISDNFAYEIGYGDPRYGLAIAAAGWNGEKVKMFLTKCLASQDTGLVYAAKNALEGKYIKHR